MNLDITCKTVGDLSADNGKLDVTLNDVNPDFIEQLEVRDIVKHTNSEELIKALDYDDIVDFLEMVYDVKVLEQK